MKPIFLVLSLFRFLSGVAAENVYRQKAKDSVSSGKEYLPFGCDGMNGNNREGEGPSQPWPVFGSLLTYNGRMNVSTGVQV